MYKVEHIQSLSVVSAAALLVPGLALGLDFGGVDIGITPRVEVGGMYYKYLQGPVSKSVPPATTQPGENYTQEQIEFTSTMPTLGGGLTFFWDRVFLDLSAQRAFNGSADDTSSYSQYLGTLQYPLDGVSRYSSANLNYNSDFDRDDYAISLGYNFDQVGLYAGYKWAKTDFTTVASGPQSFFVADYIYGSYSPYNFVAEGIIRTTADYDFKYDGPFIGLVYGFGIDKGFFKGNLSFNAAVAFLNGEVNVNNRSDVTTINSINGLSIDPFQVVPGSIPAAAGLGTNAINSKGDTTGFTFGITWAGSTAVKGLGYSLNLGFYQYQFGADQSSNPDITESAINFKAGISYEF